MPDRVIKHRYTPGQTAIVRLVWMLVGAVLAAMTLFPLLWMLSIAFKPDREIFDMRLVPATPTLGNFAYVFIEVDFLRYLANTFICFSTRWPAMPSPGCASRGARRSS